MGGWISLSDVSDSTVNHLASPWMMESGPQLESADEVCRKNLSAPDAAFYLDAIGGC
jgi:hypothetical protein